jgi:organic radical activating enzyme
MDKNKLLKESKVFCILPWIHLHTTPSGKALPCCVTEQRITDFGNTNNSSIEDLINSEAMKELRLNMLNEKETKTCRQCYNFEKEGIGTFRQSSNANYGESYFNEIVQKTNSDGSIDDFKMIYFDVRFSNICNFKCRTCAAEYSSQWENEDLKNKLTYARIIPKNNKPELVDEILTHIDHIDTAYFAGGEPLITEEHYIILEEMIRRGRTDIILRYNSNLSNFKFKDKDVLSLWKHFKKGVEISASIDHFGKRAEYIRNGTDWNKVEDNLRILKNLPHINLSINTVLGLYNYLTLADFYQYLMDKDLFFSQSGLHYSIYNMTGPVQLTSQALPLELKKEGKEKILRLKSDLIKKGVSGFFLSQLDNAIQWAESNHTWEQHRDLFWKETKRLDEIRGENFVETFPELEKLLSL